MALILFDTNIFIDLLNGVHQATVELGSYDRPAISIITCMELRAGEIPRPEDKPILDAILAEFEIIEVSRRITDAAIAIRGSSFVTPPKVRLPDCIIGATAQDCGVPLVTRNRRDFINAGIVVHVPYEYDSATGLVSEVKPAYGNFSMSPSIPRKS
jgi:predicted nucleic acid-binding protein